MKFIKFSLIISTFYIISAQEWTLNISVEINLFNMDNYSTDEENYLGVDENASDEYDILDIPEPPPPPSDYISFYFPHPEWNNEFSNNFTQDIKVNNEEIYTNNGKIWIAYVYSTAFGETSIITSQDENYPDCDYDIIIDNITHTNQSNIITSLEAFSIKEIEIKVYNCDDSMSKNNNMISRELDINIYPNPFN